MIHLKNHPNQTCDYWLITPDQDTLCIDTNIFSSGQLQNNTVDEAMSILITRVISTSNHMFKREIWDKFTEFTFEILKFQFF